MQYMHGWNIFATSGAHILGIRAPDGELQAAVARVGLLVQPKGITLWGSTACGWAEGKLNRPNAFAPLTGVKYVWLSVGGNDYFKPPDRRQPMPTAEAHDAEVGRCVRQIALAIARSPAARTDDGVLTPPSPLAGFSFAGDDMSRRAVTRGDRSAANGRI